MELSKSDIKMTKGVAILFMLLLHLFCRKAVNGLYETFPLVNGVPLVYYLALFGDACVPIYCFASGYGLFTSSSNGRKPSFMMNFNRIFKLLANYWVVLILFVAIGFIGGKPELYPGHLTKFILNFFVISYSYCGAWWFLQTYIILVFLSPLIFKLITRYKSQAILMTSGIIYLICYIQRIKQILKLDGNTALNMLVNIIVLAGTSQLPFIIGAIFQKEKIYTRVHAIFNGFSHKNKLCVAGIFILVLIHSIYESMIIAPFTGIAFICLFNLIDKNAAVQKVFNFFGKHSTNLWLTHMFFYLTIFPEIVFAPKYPALIFFWLVVLCLVSSYTINLLYNPLNRLIDKHVQGIT